MAHAISAFGVGSIIFYFLNKNMHNYIKIIFLKLKSFIRLFVL